MLKYVNMNVKMFTQTLAVNQGSCQKYFYLGFVGPKTDQKNLLVEINSKKEKLFASRSSPQKILVQYKLPNSSFCHLM